MIMITPTIAPTIAPIRLSGALQPTPMQVVAVVFVVVLAVAVVESNSNTGFDNLFSIL